MAAVKQPQCYGGHGGQSASESVTQMIDSGKPVGVTYPRPSLDGRVRYAQPRRGFRSGIEPVLLAAAIPARQGSHVLEGGCGAGAALLCLAARVRRRAGPRDRTGSAWSRSPAKTPPPTAGPISASCQPTSRRCRRSTHSTTPAPIRRITAKPARHRPTRRAGPQSARQRACCALGRRPCAPFAARGTLTFILPAALLPEAAAAFTDAGCAPTAMLPLVAESRAAGETAAAAWDQGQPSAVPRAARTRAPCIRRRLHGGGRCNPSRRKRARPLGGARPRYADGAGATAAHVRQQGSPCCADACHPASADGGSASSQGCAATARPPRNPTDRRRGGRRSTSCPTGGACSAVSRPHQSPAQRPRRPCLLCPFRGAHVASSRLTQTRVLNLSGSCSFNVNYTLLVRNAALLPQQSPNTGLQFRPLTIIIMGHSRATDKLCLASGRSSRN